MTGTAHQRFIIILSVLPLLGVLVAIWLVAQGRVSTLDIALLVGFYTATALGVSAGFHRMLAHRSFATHKPTRVLLTLCGTMGAEGPPLIWTAHHRKHHKFSDKEGDPHSPYEGDISKAKLTLRGFWRSHMGWLMNPKLSSEVMRYVPDLVREKEMRWMSQHFLAIVTAGMLLPGLIALLLTGRIEAFLTGVLWGGLVRTFFLHHFTYGVNSLGHIFGRRRFKTTDLSRNLMWLAIPSFGEAWHNNHHAFPTSASHGLRWWEIDLSAMFIRLLELLGLAWDVRRIDRDRQRTKELAFLSGQSEGNAMRRAPTHDEGDAPRPASPRGKGEPLRHTTTNDEGKLLHRATADEG